VDLQCPSIDMYFFATSMAYCALNFDIQMLIRSSVWASKYSLEVLSKLFMPFMRYIVVTRSDSMDK